jgi:hypothetical protein
MSTGYVLARQGATPFSSYEEPLPQKSKCGKGVCLLDPTLDDGFERQFFSYVLDRVVPASAVQDPNQVQIGSDADFEWWWILASRTSGLLKVMMKENGTGRDFIGTSTPSGAAAFNGINIDNWAGTALATAAWPLAVPYIMPATRVYQILFSDTSAAPNTVQLVFSGFKLWPRPRVQ